jgi:hypothetical protein
MTAGFDLACAKYRVEVASASAASLQSPSDVPSCAVPPMLIRWRAEGLL